VSILHRKVFSSLTCKLQLEECEEESGREELELNFCLMEGRWLRFVLICTLEWSDGVKWFSKLFLLPASTNSPGKERIKEIIKKTIF